MATTKLLTAEDLFEMGSDCDRELIRGELAPVSPASHRSSAIAAWLIYKLGTHVYEHRLGQLSGSDGGYRISHNPDTVVAPDVAFVSAQRLPPVEEQSKFLNLAPDMVVEVVSPSDRYTDLHDKVMLYLNAGVRLVWVIDPARETVTSFAPEQPPRIYAVADTLETGGVLPGFILLVSDLFQ
jgi:Uma2 family endonuclease